MKGVNPTLLGVGVSIKAAKKKEETQEKRCEKGKKT